MFWSKFHRNSHHHYHIITFLYLSTLFYPFLLHFSILLNISTLLYISPYIFIYFTFLHFFLYFLTTPFNSLYISPYISCYISPYISPYISRYISSYIFSLHFSLDFGLHFSISLYTDSFLLYNFHSPHYSPFLPTLLLTLTLILLNSWIFSNKITWNSNQNIMNLLSQVTQCQLKNHYNYDN